MQDSILNIKVSGKKKRREKKTTKIGGEKPVADV